MGTITGQQVIDRAWIKGQDLNGGTGVRWPAAEALLWLNDGQREIVNLLPSSNTVSAFATVTAGTRQTLAGLGLPSGITFVDIPRNVSIAGVPGRAMTLRKREWLDEQRPNWHSEVASEAVHWMLDPRDPKTIYLYPAIALAAGKLEIVYVATPADLPTLASPISLDDINANALQWFVLFSFYSKDATFSGQPGKAPGYYQQFQQSLGIKANATQQNAATAGVNSGIGQNIPGKPA